MTLAFYFDNDMPDAALYGLRRHSVRIITAREEGLARAADEYLLQRATELGLVMVSEDRDFTRITTRWLREGRTFAGLIIVPQSRLQAGKIIEDLLLFAQAMGADEMIDRVEFLPL